ncbi:hypothetical protein [Massilia soli]|uniref:Uncharacterized protein n=1 Tax=Massilia soli TaxID=2792854 RepID=A0ABS7SS68_9BURK|nr:hypothetical protein [Massilia soli]MBZ2208798.1 hypothetical protein [Massilia soli]
MKSLILATLLACAGVAQAQNLALPEPMKLAPLTGPSAMDPAETPMLAQDAGSGDFRTWYTSQKRPAMAVYFNRELDQLPPGWEGRSRLLIEDTIVAGKEVDARTISVGVQQNTQRQSRARSQLARLFEQSLGAELKKQNVHLVDSTVLHRKLAASNRDTRTDIEYDSLSRAARFVLEVELVCLNGECEAVANLKDIRNGDVPATVRQKIGTLDNSSEIDRISRALVQRLMQFKVV